MLPDDVASTKAVFAAFLDPQKDPRDFLVAYEMGGVALSDPSQGLRVKLWTLKVESKDDVQYVNVYASGVPKTTLFTSIEGITEADLAFDQNMKPVVAYVERGIAKLWWYDATIPGTTVLTLPAGSSSPRCTLDDKRLNQTSVSDVLVLYMRAGNVCRVQQRNRYATEVVLGTLGPDAYLVSVGMNNKWRIQWRAYNATPSGDDKYYVNVQPYLGDVVTSICKVAGLVPGDIDVSELYEDRVPGLKIDVDVGLDKPIDWLREIFMFDKSDYDRRIHFPKRGRPVVARIPYNHLVAEDPQALEQVITDQKKLPRLVNINHLDPDAGLAKNKQTAERRSNVVETNVSKTIESQVVLTVDQAATSASTRLKIYWNELISYKFATSIRYTHLVVTDVIEVEDSKGTWNRMRLTDRNEDSGVIKWEAEQDAGDLVYKTQRVGNALPPPVSTTPGVISETILDIINTSPIRDSNDDLGVYIAACGESTAWTGYQLLYSVDGGLSYMEAFRSSTPSLIGETENDLEEDPHVQYPSQQYIDVIVNFPLSSVTYDQILLGLNLCCVGDEMMQFTTATSLGTEGTKYRYRLTGLVRGRYNTESLFWPMGTRFVFMDSSVIFAPIPRSMIGSELTYKAVSYGLTEDETVPTLYEFDDPQSQLEWPVFDVASERVGSDAVVTWMGRMRLGTDTTPYHSKYWRGYKVKFSDGHTVVVQSETYTYTAIPGSPTVQVCSTNEITGDGPWSTAIPA